MAESDQYLASVPSASRDDGPPPHFICPITHNVMMEPMMDREGNTYEKDAILDWFSRKNTSPVTRTKLFEHPLTREELLKDHLFPNRALRAAIEQYAPYSQEIQLQLVDSLKTEKSNLQGQLEETKKKLDKAEKTNKRMADKMESFEETKKKLDKAEKTNKRNANNLAALEWNNDELEKENDKQKKRLRALWRMVQKLENELVGAGVQLPDDCYGGYEPLRADDFVEDFKEQFELSEAEAISMARKEVEAYNSRLRKMARIEKGAYDL